MNNPTKNGINPCSILKWTTAPLRLETGTQLLASQNAVFESLTDPDQMCEVFSWMHHISVDEQTMMKGYGVGTKRFCHFGNGMVLEEVIVEWHPPYRYAYRGNDENHPFGMTGHLGIIECTPGGKGTQLIWKHYFDHSNLKAMLGQLNASVQMVLESLIERFNGTQADSS